MNKTKDVGPAEADTAPAANHFTLRLGLAVVATLGISILFRLLPALDIETTRLFYREGSGFAATSMHVWKGLRTLGLWSMNGAMAIVAVLTILRCLVPASVLPNLVRRLHPSQLLFLTASAAIGPGLITNIILKDHWGRARPIMTSIFGGPQSFSLPWTISDACHSNCSFVSGEGSGVFWLIAFIFVVPISWRKTLLAPLLVWIVAISLNRIAFGGHYLSDVVIGWGLMLIVILICHEVLVARLGPAIDGWFARRQGS